MAIVLIWLAQIALVIWLPMRGREREVLRNIQEGLYRFGDTLRETPALMIWGGGAILMAMIGLGAGFSDPGVMAAALASAAVQALLFLIVLGGKFLGELSQDMTFGSARFASVDHAKQMGLLGKDGIRLGVMLERKSKNDPTITHPVHYTGERHLLTVAPTRAGKGVSVVIPNLLTYPGSTLVIDPKGENARLTHERRSKIGNAFVLDPWSITGKPGARYNPLDILKPDSPTLIEDALLIAGALVIGNEREPFWSDEAKALIMGFLLHLATSPQEEGQRHLGRLRDILCMTMDGLLDVGAAMSESDHPVVVSSAARMITKDDKLLMNILSSAQQNTHFLESPALREHLSASDFSFRDLKGETPSSVYVVLPVERLSTYNRWLRMLVALGITELARTPVATKRPVLFLLDEFAQLGHLKVVEDAYGLMAGMGIQLHAIVQDLSQLERLYEKGWQTFIGNAGVIQVFGTRDLKTAEYASKMLGTTTRTVRSTSSNSSANGSSSSVSFAPTQRPLVFPDELMRMGDKAQILFVENADPVLGQKLRWFEDAELSALAKGTAEALEASAAPTYSNAERFNSAASDTLSERRRLF